MTVTAKKIVVVVLSSTLVLACSLENVKLSSESIGSVAGGLLGGALGNAACDGSDQQELCTLVGVAAGAYIGNRVGKHLDEKDKERHAQATAAALSAETENSSAGWENTENGTSGKVSVVSKEQKQVTKTVPVLKDRVETVMPLEQLGSAGKLGPYTDIYALAATAYCALTGKPPADCNDRVISNDFVPAVEAAKDKASQQFLQAVDWGLALKCEERPQNLEEWHEAFVANDKTQIRIKPARKTVQAVKMKPEASVTKQSPSQQPTKIKWLAIAGLLFFIIGGVFWVLNPFSNEQEKNNNLTSDEPSTIPSTIPTPLASQEPKNPATPSSSPTEIVDTQDSKDFKKAAYIDTPEAYELYLRLHPQGKYLEDAREKVQQ